MDILELKFNSRQGALICSRCRHILATGWEHDGLKTQCRNCGKNYSVKKVWVWNQTDDGHWQYRNIPE